MAASHDSFLALLHDRLNTIRTVHSLWAQGDYRGAIVTMVRMGDVSRGLGVALDVLPMVMQPEVMASLPEDVLIDIYVLVLPVIVGILNNNYEEYVAVHFLFFSFFSFFAICCFSLLIFFELSTIGPCLKILTVLLPSYQKLSLPSTANTIQRY